MEKVRKKLDISFNSPIVLTFSMICLAALIMGTLTGGITNDLLFSVYRSSLASPFTYLRFIGHVFGHVGWDHFIGNITLLLLIGPMLEEKYGSKNILFVILATAVITGLVNFIFFPHVHLLGASGVVFAFILLSSFTSISDGKIPLTFLLVLIIYMGGQVYDALFVKDNVSNLTHIIGGGVGSVLGYVMTKNKMDNYH
ncbi:MAG: rhomboid family intramembrane serine protease [Ruminococcus sp.]|jgi:GlpG protein|nr:rhomboid family intramembrane serine protease [Ruminococcus sp.]